MELHIAGFLIAVIFVVTLLVIAFDAVRQRELSAGRIANCLAWLAVSEFVIGMVVGFPYPAPPKEAMVTMLVAALITVLCGLAAWLAYVNQPTRAVKKHRERKKR